jgi:hypothetical protein
MSHTVPVGVPDTGACSRTVQLTMPMAHVRSASVATGYIGPNTTAHGTRSPR